MHHQPLFRVPQALNGAGLSMAVSPVLGLGAAPSPVQRSARISGSAVDASSGTSAHFKPDGAGAPEDCLGAPALIPSRTPLRIAMYRHQKKIVEAKAPATACVSSSVQMARSSSKVNVIPMHVSEAMLAVVGLEAASISPAARRQLESLSFVARAVQVARANWWKQQS